MVPNAALNIGGAYAVLISYPYPKLILSVLVLLVEHALLQHIASFHIPLPGEQNEKALKIHIGPRGLLIEVSSTG